MARPPGAMCLPHTNNMDNSKLQGTGPGGGASLRPRAGGVPLEPFIHQVGRNDVCFRKADLNVELHVDVNLYLNSHSNVTNIFFSRVCLCAGGGSHQYDAL